MSITGIFVFLFVLLVLVIVHEAGHFLAAKALGMRVDEFAVGFPPRVWAKKWGETTYAINALPIGGYVSLLGENGVDEVNKEDARAFQNRPWWAQTIVLLAGVTMNMVLAYILLVAAAFGTLTVSEDDPLFTENAANQRLIILQTQEGSPARLAGLKGGDVVSKLSSGTTIFEGKTASEAVAFIQNNIGSVTFTLGDNEEESRSITLAGVYGIIPDKKALGVGIERVADVEVSFVQSFVRGWEDTRDLTILIWNALVEFFGKLFHGENVFSQMAGPIGIAKVVDTTRSFGVDPLLTLAALLSINLAFFNALPFPALDGGRVIITWGEALFRRKLKAKWNRIINATGFLLLMALLLAVTVKDIGAL